MADFPTSVAALTNPTPTDTLASPSHSGQHTDANDEVEAIETFLLGTSFDVRSYGAVGDGVADDTAEIQAALAASASAERFGEVIAPPGTYKVSDTLEVGRFQTLRGGGQGSTGFNPTAMAVPVIDLTGLPGGEGAKVSGLAINSGGTADTPAIRADTYLPVIEHCRIENWAGRGILAGTTISSSVHAMIRDTRVTGVTGDGVVINATQGVYENVISSNGDGNGFVLGGTSGTLIGCSADTNGGHGFVVTAGEWYLQVYGEANTGDVLHVDGTLGYVTGVTLSAAASLGATSLTVTALTKLLPRGSILRFVDGTATYALTGAGIGATTITLGAPLTAGQSSSAVATLAADDLPIASLPTVVIASSYLDGTISLHACRYAFIGGGYPIGQTLTATTSAHMIGESEIPHRNQLTTGSTWGGGGSYALSAMLGATEPTIPIGLAHLADPNANYQLFPAADPALYTSDATSLTGFMVRLAGQWSYVETARYWTVRALPAGQYVIRLHVRDTAQTAGNVQLQTPNGSTTFATKTAGWEWVEVEYTQTAAIRVTGTGKFTVQRQTATSDVDIDAIVIVPRAQLLSTVGVVQSGRSTTAARPAPDNVGIGAMWFDTTLNEPIWSDGTAWIEAAGASAAELPELPIPVAFSSIPASAAWPDAADHVARFYVHVPADYVDGDLIVKIMRRAGAGSGTAQMHLDSYRFRDATGFSQIHSGTGFDFTPGDTNSHLLTITFTAANIAAGDVIRGDFWRVGTDGADDLAGAVDWDGGWYALPGA